MNIKDYEKQAETLTKQAERLEATMLTYRALAHCVKNGHNFHYHYDEEKKTIRGLCEDCGIFVEGENTSMWFADENEEGFGDLAGKRIDEIDTEFAEPPSETSEPAGEPTLPVEDSKAASIMTNEKGSGNYRVDTSGYFKGGE